MDSEFDTVTKGFEKAVTVLQDNLQYLADHDKVSDSFIAKQNRIIRDLIMYQKFAEQRIAWQEQELLEEAKLRRDTLKKYQDEIVSFEAICIMHGVTNYERFLRWGKLTLIHHAKTHLKKKSFRLNVKMNSLLKELPDEERNVIETILFRKLNTKLKTVLKQIQTTKNRFIYGTGV